MRILTLTLALLTAAPATADLFDAFGLGVYAAKVGDTVSTEIALRRLGTYEANPLMRNRGVRLATTVAAPLLFNCATAHLHETHPRAALWMRIGVVVGWGYITAHNLRAGN